MNNNSYKNKYLKYKKKYLDLKGGGVFDFFKKKDNAIEIFKNKYPTLYNNNIYKNYIDLLINNGFSIFNTEGIINNIDNINEEDEKNKKLEKLKKLIEYKIKLDTILKDMPETDHIIAIIFKKNNIGIDINKTDKENMDKIIENYKIIIDFYIRYYD